MKWSIALANILCVILIEVAASKTVNRTSALTNQTTVDADGSREAENIYNVSLCEGNSSAVCVVIPASWTLRLSCDSPRLTNGTNVRWYKDDNNATWSGYETKNTSMNKSTSEMRLKLTNVSLSHSGNYSCSVDNKTCHRTILVKDPEAPEIYTDYKSLIFTDVRHTNRTITVGSNATVYAPSVLILICNASGSPNPDIHWTKNGGEILGTQVSEGSKLFLFHGPDQTGEYSCQARNFMGSAKLSSYITFIEPMRPVIVPSRYKISAIYGENHVLLKVGDDLMTIAGTAIEIQCLTSGIPKPNIFWYYNGRVCQNLHLTSLRKISSFHHKSISPNASGNYTCVATNAFGEASATSYINAIEPVMPYINSSEEDIASYDMTYPLGKTIGGSLKCLVGASIWLECPMGGIPLPEIVWEKDNLPILFGKRIKIFHERIERIQFLGTMMSDTGLYSCIASNGVGTVAKETFVHLIVPEKPRIKRDKHQRNYIVDNLPTPFSADVGIDLRILAHRKVTVYCSAKGFPKPVLSWRKNGRRIVKKDGVFVSESGDKLIFMYLKMAQSGYYSCVASNAAGEDVANTMLIGRLPLMPKLEITKAILSKYQPSPQKNVEVYEIPDTEPQLVRGSDVIIECIARRGYPRSDFEWFKDGKRINAKIKNSFNRSNLKLRNVQKSDEGTYKCFASNIIGQHEKTIELRLQSVHVTK